MPFQVPRNEPLRPSEIKTAIYGSMFRGARRGGLRFDRVLHAGWSFRPSIGLVAKDINKLGLDLQSFREPLVKSIKLVMIPSFRKNFMAGGRPEPWEPLAEYTVRVRGYSAWPILVRTGALKKAVTKLSIWEVGATSATIRHMPARVWYGAIHQAGYGSLMDVARRELGGQASAKDIEQRATELFLGARPASQQTKIVIPQREFVLFQDEDIEKIQFVFIEWMEERAARVGRSWNAL